MKNFKILVVDDEYEYQKVFKTMLERKGYIVSACSSAKEAINKINAENYDLILTDLKMKEMDGLSLLEEIKRIDTNIEVILVTGYGTIESAVEAMKKGAFSYFIKGYNPEALLMDIDKITKIKKLEKDNNILRNQQKREDFILDTKNEDFKRILDISSKAAVSDLNILILGESGTGKEVLARHIHNISNRYKGHFVAVNCHVFTEGLLESEFFGHEKGAFTGALTRRIGRFEEANEGTLFLDEIGEMSVSTQVKLLRAIETKSIERIGSNDCIPMDLRFISATNRNIIEEINKGNFREDLYYRINAITIEIPPLRDRREDLPLFIKFFFNNAEKESKKKILKIEEKVQKFLLNYHYPGNIRELKNIIERLVVLSEDGIVKAKDLPINNEIKNSIKNEDFEVRSLREARKEFEAKYISKVLKKYSGSIAKASKYLDITSRQLYNKISEYNIKIN